MQMTEAIMKIGDDRRLDPIWVLAVDYFYD